MAAANSATSATSATSAGGTSTSTAPAAPMTLAEINKRIAAAEKYKGRMQNQGRTAQAAGAYTKLDDYYRQRAALTKPPSLQDQLGLQETLDIQGAQDTYNAGAALREYQIKQSYYQLQDALGTINRAAIANYKDIGNDYAARGMARSQGFNVAEAEAMAEKNRADLAANAARTSFLEQLATEDFNARGGKNATVESILADFLARKFSAAQGG